MAEAPLFNGLTLLTDQDVRAVLEFLLRIMSASKLRISYELSMTPARTENALNKLLEAKLIRVQTDIKRQLKDSGLGDVYAPTEAGRQLYKFLQSK